VRHEASRVVALALRGPRERRSEPVPDNGAVPAFPELPRSSVSDVRQLPAGVEQDAGVLAGLNWLASTTGDAKAFWRRLEAAQTRYRHFTEARGNLGQDPELVALGPDIVAAYLAQAKSLLDGRRTYDIALASRCIPWVKQIGVNVKELSKISGAAERAGRMLADHKTEPDGALLELLMGGNYAAEGFKVAFVEEAKGRAKSPDLHLFVPGSKDPVAIELKRLRQGAYERDERIRHRQIFRQVAALIDERRLSVHIDADLAQGFTGRLRNSREILFNGGRCPLALSPRGALASLGFLHLKHATRTSG
jgi:hypothetical protein